jgi:hypothetical protein
MGECNVANAKGVILPKDCDGVAQLVGTKQSRVSLEAPPNLRVVTNETYPSMPMRPAIFPVEMAALTSSDVVASSKV